MEYFDVCNEEGLPTGEVISRDEAHREGKLHRTSHVWVVQKSDETPSGFQVLLQKRHHLKESFPGRLDTSSAGHIPAGQEPLESALRELEEELGIAATEEQLHYIGHSRGNFQMVFHDKLFKDNEYSNVYVYTDPIRLEDIHIQEEELEGVGWYDYEETLEACRRRDERYCAPAVELEMLGEYIKGDA